MSIREEIEALFNIHVNDGTDFNDIFAYYDRSGKISQKKIIDCIIICLKHIEEIEKNDDGSATASKTDTTL